MRPGMLYLIFVKRCFTFFQKTCFLKNCFFKKIYFFKNLFFKKFLKNLFIFFLKTLKNSRVNFSKKAPDFLKFSENPR